MKRLYVKPQYRKYKIGEALVNEILLQAKQLDYAVMKLDTLERLQAAIQLYLKKGFVISNAYYENPLPNVVYMEKQLT
jgi:ribosomal protein S18 acetylase RimI-like enzyme